MSEIDPPEVAKKDTLTTPAACAVVLAVTFVALITLTVVANDVPKVTELVPVRFVPLIVTVVPPSVEPTTGVTEMLVGAEISGVAFERGDAAAAGIPMTRHPNTAARAASRHPRRLALKRLRSRALKCIPCERELH